MLISIIVCVTVACVVGLERDYSDQVSQGQLQPDSDMIGQTNRSDVLVRITQRVGKMRHYRLPRCTDFILGPDEHQFRIVKKYLSRANGFWESNTTNLATTQWNNVSAEWNRTALMVDSSNTYRLNDTGKVLDRVTFNRSIPEADTITKVCVPLSPQLYNCPHTMFHQIPPEYHIDNNLTLLSPDGASVLASLGDYFVDEHGNAVACAQPITMPQRGIPRCNYLNITPGEFEVLHNGSWLMKQTKEILNYPQFLARAETDYQFPAFNVCWPLSVAFIGCPLKLIIEKHQLKITNDHQLIVAGRKTWKAGEYFRFYDDAVICHSPDDNSKYILESVYQACLAMSLLCLLLTVINQAMAPKPTNHSNCILCHVSSMLVANITFNVKRGQIGNEVCYALYVVGYTAQMSAFFWLNVMSFDAWKFFSGHIGTSRFPLTTGRWLVVGRRQRFAAYCVYAWGAPMLLCALSLVIDQTKSLQESLGIYPGIIQACWLNDRTAFWAFCYGPLAALIVLNTVYYVLTVINLRFAGSGTDLVNRKRNMQLFLVCLKLFVVMGLLRIVSLITWVIYDETRFGMFFYASNVCTGIEGICVSIVYLSSEEGVKNLRRWLNADAIKTRFCRLPSIAKFHMWKINTRNSHLKCAPGDSNRILRAAIVPPEA